MRKLDFLDIINISSNFNLKFPNTDNFTNKLKSLVSLTEEGIILDNNVTQYDAIAFNNNQFYYLNFCDAFHFIKHKYPENGTLYAKNYDELKNKVESFVKNFFGILNNRLILTKNLKKELEEYIKFIRNFFSLHKIINEDFRKFSSEILNYYHALINNSKIIDTEGLSSKNTIKLRTTRWDPLYNSLHRMFRALDSEFTRMTDTQQSLESKDISNLVDICIYSGETGLEIDFVTKDRRFENIIGVEAYEGVKEKFRRNRYYMPRVNVYLAHYKDFAFHNMVNYEYVITKEPILIIK